MAGPRFVSPHWTMSAPANNFCVGFEEMRSETGTAPETVRLRAERTSCKTYNRRERSAARRFKLSRSTAVLEAMRQWKGFLFGMARPSKPGSSGGTT